MDARVLAATNRDLEVGVKQGSFREDLFYRLKVMMVRVPPLREHAEDIPFLAETFLQRYLDTAQLGPRRFTREALRHLEQYPWPGNVRELTHVIERAVTLSDGEWIREVDLGLDDQRFETGVMSDAPYPPLSVDEMFNLDTVTQRLVVAALRRTRGHKARAAALLGIHPRTLTRMMRRYHLPEGPEDTR